MILVQNVFDDTMSVFREISSIIEHHQPNSTWDPTTVALRVITASQVCIDRRRSVANDVCWWRVRSKMVLWDSGQQLRKLRLRIVLVSSSSLSPLWSYSLPNLPISSPQKYMLEMLRTFTIHQRSPRSQNPSHSTFSSVARSYEPPVSRQDCVHDNLVEGQGQDARVTLEASISGRCSAVACDAPGVCSQDTLRYHSYILLMRVDVQMGDQQHPSDRFDPR